MRSTSWIHCFRLNRFKEQKDWRLWDLSVSSSGNIALSGHHWENGRTFIDLYSGREFSSTNKPKVIYSKEFDKYSNNYRRCVALFENAVEKLVTSVGDKIEVIDFKRKRVARSRRVKDTIRCISVSEEQIITASGSSKVSIYDKSLSKIKSLIMEELPGVDQPDDMIVAADKLYLCTQTQGKAMSLRKTNGNILTDFSPTTAEEPKAYSVAVSSQLHLLAVLWNGNEIAFYPLSDSKSVLETKLDHDVSKIRISDTGILVTGNERTGDVKVYNLIDNFFTYENTKTILMSLLQKDDCQKLSEYFTLSQDQTTSILQSDNSPEALLTALEGKGVCQHSNVNRMIEAFRDLNKGETSYILAELYQKKQDLECRRSRISDTCDKMVTENKDTADKLVTENKDTAKVQIHDVEDIITFGNLKKYLGLQLKREECVRLAEFFSLSKEVAGLTDKSDMPVEILFLALEEKGVLQECNVDRLTQAFQELEMPSSYIQITEFYQRTRVHNEPTRIQHADEWPT